MLYGIYRDFLDTKVFSHFFLTVFRVELSCTGKVDSEVMILMQLNLTVNSSKNFTVLNFKRRKMCYKSKEFI